MPPKPNLKVRSCAALNSVTSERLPQLISQEPSADRRAEPQQKLDGTSGSVTCSISVAVWLASLML